MFILPTGMELGGSKDCYVWNILMYRNGKVDSSLTMELVDCY